MTVVVGHGILAILESVKDEGGFWEGRDVKALVETVGQWNRQIAGRLWHFYDLAGGAISAPITAYPDFEHLEADGHRGMAQGPMTPPGNSTPPESAPPANGENRGQSQNGADS